MKLRSVSIRNLGSLRDVGFTDFSDLAILVGKNGAGKSYIFNALQLLFQEFAIVGGLSAVSANDYMWYRRNTQANIIIRASIELSSTEFQELAQYAGLNDQDITSAKKSKLLMLDIVRELQYKGAWITTLLKLGARTLVQQDELVQEPPPPTPIDLSPWTLYLFEPNATATDVKGARLLVNPKAKTAYYSRPDIDALVTSHALRVSEESRGLNHEEWAAANGIAVVTRPPTSAEAKDVSDALDQAKERENAPVIAPGFAEKIRTSFHLIPAARDSRETSSFRLPLLDGGQAEGIRELSLSREVDSETKWGNLGSDVEQFLSKRLEPNPDQVLARDKGLRLPLSHLGAGEQSLVALEWHFLSQATIFAIEDPENHLHPDLARKIFRLLKQKAAARQLLVSTHSPFLIDKEDPGSNWMVAIEGQETAISRCKDDIGLRAILTELGMLPSDIFYRDLVLFVEGGTEKEAVFPIWLDKLGVPIRGNNRIGVLSIGGDSRLKDNLRIWLEIAQAAPTEYHVVLDGHSGTLPQQLNTEMGIPLDRFTVLPKHAIEDYYPPRFVVEALKALYEIEVNTDDVRARDGESRADTVKSILEKAGKTERGWKVSLGQYVASRMKLGEIPDEFKTIAQRIDSALK